MSEILHCDINKILTNDIIDAKLKKNGNIIENVEPLLYYSNSDRLSDDEEVLVFKASKFGQDEYFYIRKKLFIPYLEDNNTINFGNQLIQALENLDSLKLSSNKTYIEIIQERLDREYQYLNKDGTTPSTTEEPVAFFDTVELTDSLGVNATQIPLPLEEDKDYKHKLLQITVYDVDEEVEDIFYRLIKEFNYNADSPEESYVDVGTPIETNLTIGEGFFSKIECAIYVVGLDSFLPNILIALRTENGYALELTERDENTGESGFKLITPSHSLTVHEDTIVNEEGTLYKLSDKYFEYVSADYSQLYGGGVDTRGNPVHAEMTDHEFRRPYKFGIYNKDYTDPVTTKHLKHQEAIIQTPKHLLALVDASGNMAEFGTPTFHEGYLLYSSLDGNFLKLTSDTSVESCLSLRTKEAHRLFWDASNMLFEHYKHYDKDAKGPILEDKPVNYIHMIKDEVNNQKNSIEIGSKNYGDDNASKYEKLFNKFKFSQDNAESITKFDNSFDLDQNKNNALEMKATSSESQVKLDNNASTTSKNTMTVKATSSASEIVVANETSSGKNNVKLSAGSDTTIEIKNEFASGQVNKVTMKKNLIEIESGGSDKTKITIDTNGMKIETLKKVNVEATQDVLIKSSSKATINAPQVKITGGMLETNGTAGPPGTTGPFCSLPACIFSGAPHLATKVNGT